ncbi:MAG TPA: SdpI family protein [Stellaceae bacterium]|nr:SdpI family protein [Stellaceae bacterium]
MARFLFMAMPALLFVLGVPLALKLIPPNRFYGFRTRKTFSSLDAWYRINLATGFAMMAAGAVGGLAVLALSQDSIALQPDLRYAAGILLTAAASLLFLALVAVYARTV